jgi:thiamine-phosphate pyrophosphorylase
VSLPNSSAAGSKPAGTNPILCYVTDRHSLQLDPRKSSIRLLTEKIERIVAAGVDWVQLREKDLSGKDASLLAREALRCASNHAAQALEDVPVRILVNNRLDVALAEQAGGVHLSENSVPMEEAKRLLLAFRSTKTPSRDFLIGASCHSLEAAKSAASHGASYIHFGPIFATPSKAAFGPPQGLERLAEVCSSVRIPVLAIGGITLENVRSCFSAGASGIAAIRLFQDCDDPGAIARAIRQRSL